MIFGQTFSYFYSLYTLPHTSVGLTSCISIAFFSFQYFDLFDHYAACWFPLRSKDSFEIITVTT